MAAQPLNPHCLGCVYAKDRHQAGMTVTEAAARCARIAGRWHPPYSPRWPLQPAAPPTTGPSPTSSVSLISAPARSRATTAAAWPPCAAHIRAFQLWLSRRCSSWLRKGSLLRGPSSSSQQRAWPALAAAWRGVWPSWYGCRGPTCTASRQASMWHGSWMVCWGVCWGAAMGLPGTHDKAIAIRAGCVQQLIMHRPLLLYLTAPASPYCILCICRAAAWTHLRRLRQPDWAAAGNEQPLHLLPTSACGTGAQATTCTGTSPTLPQPGVCVLALELWVKLTACGMVRPCC